jgi:hypothetical protein
MQMPDLDFIACGKAKEAISVLKRFTFEFIKTGISLIDIDGLQMITGIRKAITIGILLFLLYLVIPTQVRVLTPMIPMQ